MKTMYKIAITVAIVCAALYMVHHAWAAQKKSTHMPEGTYKDKCSECTFDETSNTLECTCRYGQHKNRTRKSKKSGCSKFTSSSGTLGCDYSD